jgi:cytochrome c5
MTTSGTNAMPPHTTATDQKNEKFRLAVNCQHHQTTATTGIIRE